MPNLKTIKSKRQENKWNIDPFYNNQPWRKLRIKKLKQNPLCEVCQKSGHIKEGKVIDHHLPRRFWPEHSLRLENLTTMCESHHNQKSRLESTITSKTQWLNVFSNNEIFSK